jgi:hypothetical protein
VTGWLARGRRLPRVQRGRNNLNESQVPGTVLHIRGTRTDRYDDAGGARDRQNILISVGTSIGKTTILKALTTFLPADDRIALVEDTAELRIDHANLVRFEARRDQPDAPAVTIRDLLRATLRPTSELAGRQMEAFLEFVVKCSRTSETRPVGDFGD